MTVADLVVARPRRLPDATDAPECPPIARKAFDLAEWLRSLTDLPDIADALAAAQRDDDEDDES